MTTRVLYVSGAPRSGTTMVAMALGQLPGTCDLGELWALWRPAWRTGELCGCGRPVPECPFWSVVVPKALGPDFEAEGAALGELHRTKLGTGRAPLVWLHVSGHRRDPDYDRYAEGLGRHYRAAAECSGARLLVDSSKMASDALLVSAMDDVELWVLHVVRDPRGMAFSSAKDVRSPGPGGRPFDRHRPAASALRWDAYNLMAERLLAPRVEGRFLKVRYEDVAADPRGAFARILAWLGEPPDALGFEGEPPVLALRRPQHPVWGNPVRTTTGSLPIRLDDQWRRAMAMPDRLAATAVALPLLGRYRYPWWPGAPVPTPGDATTSRR